MLVALLAVALASPQSQATLTLAADCTIDKKLPDANSGREPLLKGGADKAVLIRFPELGLSIGSGKKVRSARLELALAQPGEAKLKSVGRLLRPWGEGGWRMDEFAGEKPPTVVAGATWKSALAGKAGLGWERDGALGRNDASSISVTAQTANDVFTISGLEKAVQAMVDDPQHNFGLRLEFETTSTFFSADSLGYGPKLIVDFETGSTSPAPDLRIELCELVQPGRWRARVRNAGDLDSRGQTLRFDWAGNEGTVKSSQTIAQGETKDIEFQTESQSGPELPAQQPLIVRVVPDEDERNPSDNGVTVYPGGLSVSVAGADAGAAQRVLTDLNERVFPFSKFGAWPMGCLERLRLVSDPNAADVRVPSGQDLRASVLRAVTCLTPSLMRPYDGEPPKVAGLTAVAFVPERGQAGLLPDTRDDVIIPQGLPIPDGASTALILGDLAMVEHGMLSRSETTILNTLVGKRGVDRTLPWDLTPNHIFFRVTTPDGLTPVGARLEVYQLIGGAFGGQPVFSEQVGSEGLVFMTGRPGGAFGKSNPFGELQKDGSNAWLLAVVRSNDSASSTWVPVWQLWDEAARGNRAAAFVELRVQVSSGPLDRSENLALNKLVTDFKKRFPAQLSSLVDGDEKTSVAFGQEGEGYWIEIDLGRDRQIGEVTLVFDGAPWKQFRIVTYKTAQSPDEAIVWSEEANGPANGSLVRSANGTTSLSYLSKSVRSRYLRIVPFSGEAVKLAEVRVVPIKLD